MTTAVSSEFMSSSNASRSELRKEREQDRHGNAHAPESTRRVRAVTPDLEAKRAPAGGAERADSKADPYRAFGEELEALRRETAAKIGAEDVAHITKVERFSRRMEVAGRLLIHFSVEPVSFFAGVGALFVHKQLQTTEVGHSALHGCWDGLPGAEKFNSQTFAWDAPVDEASWRAGHNVKHHASTNIGGKDPDIRFGFARLTEQTPWSPANVIAVPFALLVLFPNFLAVINAHVTGVNDTLHDNGRPERFDVIPERTWPHVKEAWTKALRKYVPYFAKELVFFPVLAGPFAPKVLLGNLLAETARNVYSAATIFCGHVGEDVKSWPTGTRPRGRGEWCAMQVEAANDFDVPLPISILCGALDKQIEHHLFPTLPPPRLREIAPRVRAICEKHGVAYKTAGWGTTLRKVFRHIGTLSRKTVTDLVM